MNTNKEKELWKELDKEVEREVNFLARPNIIAAISLNTVLQRTRYDYSAPSREAGDRGFWRSHGELFVWQGDIKNRRKLVRLFNKHAKKHGLKVNRKGTHLEKI